MDITSQEENLLQRISELIKEAQIQINSVALEYGAFHWVIVDNKWQRLPGILISDGRIRAIRDSLFYRLDSIGFHLSLLHNIQSGHQKNLALVPVHDEKTQLLALKASEQQRYIFDDIIFHIISHFDYLASLIGYILYNEEQQHWSHVVSHCKPDTGNSSSRRKKNVIRRNISTTRCAKTVLKYNDELIFRLIGYRGTLIHDQHDFAGFQVKGKQVSNGGSLKVFVPTRFWSELKENVISEEIKKLSMIEQLAMNPDEQKPSLLASALTIVETSLLATKEIVIALRDDVYYTPLSSQLVKTKKRVHRTRQNSTVDADVILREILSITKINGAVIPDLRHHTTFRDFMIDMAWSIEGISVESKDLPNNTFYRERPFFPHFPEGSASPQEIIWAYNLELHTLFLNCAALIHLNWRFDEHRKNALGTSGT